MGFVDPLGWLILHNATADRKASYAAHSWPDLVQDLFMRLRQDNEMLCRSKRLVKLYLRRVWDAHNGPSEV